MFAYLTSPPADQHHRNLQQSISLRFCLFLKNTTKNKMTNVNALYSSLSFDLIIFSEISTETHLKIFRKKDGIDVYSNAQPAPLSNSQHLTHFRALPPPFSPLPHCKCHAHNRMESQQMPSRNVGVRACVCLFVCHFHRCVRSYFDISTNERNRSSLLLVFTYFNLACSICFIFL